MRRFAVLGNPIAHSKSPQIHQAFAVSLDHHVNYDRVLVEPGDFDAAVTEFFAAGGIGLNVTAPFKGDAFEMAAIRSDAATDAKGEWGEPRVPQRGGARRLVGRAPGTVAKGRGGASDGGPRAAGGAYPGKSYFFVATPQDGSHERWRWRRWRRWLRC